MIVRKLLDDSYAQQGIRSADISNHPISQKEKKMRARKATRFAQVVVEAGLGLRSEASSWSCCCCHCLLVYWLMPSHPSSDGPASKRPFLRTQTHPSGLGKMPPPSLSVPGVITSGRTEPEPLLSFLEIADMSLSPRYCLLYWSSLTFIHQLVHMDCFKKKKIHSHMLVCESKSYFLPVNSPLFCGSRSHTHGLPSPAFQERAFDDKIM